MTNIFRSDFWIMENLNKMIFPKSLHPYKFSATSSIFVKKGTCMADIDLVNHTITAPCIVNIRNSQILQVKEVSDDFQASFIVMSNRFIDNLFLMLKECPHFTMALRHRIVNVPEQYLPAFENQIKLMSRIAEDETNPYGYQAQILSISSFFFHTAYKCYATIEEAYLKNRNRILEQFMTLVQQHFKTERFLDFYAEKLGVTSRHLSRTVKSLTGITAVEWIERYVVLEAKVLLKSTNLSVQQIADELNFPSQSFFGKYFRKNMGMSPTSFRNS